MIGLNDDMEEIDIAKKEKTDKANVNIFKTKSITILALFSAIICVLAFTPVGFIPLPLAKATIVHIPVITGSILLGYKKGAFLGFLFGMASFINNSISPSVVSFAFSPLVPVIGTSNGSALALVICFVPRILVGIVPYFVFKGLDAMFKKKRRYLTTAAAAVAGSMVNTLLVMNGIYLIFKDAYALAQNAPVAGIYGLIMSVVLINGLPEAVLAACVCGSLCGTLLKNKQVISMIE